MFIQKKNSSLIRNKSLNRTLVFICMCPLIWLFTFLIVGEKALPGKGISFSLIAFVTSGHIIGLVFEKIKMPALLGMLIVGIAFRNVPVVSAIGKSIDPLTSSILRYLQLNWQ